MNAQAKPPEQMRVWHIPQVPGKPFHVSVETVDEAAKIIDVLADYDLFQFENRIKPDYCNVSGLEVFQDGDWCEWEDDDGYHITDTPPATVA